MSVWVLSDPIRLPPSKSAAPVFALPGAADFFIFNLFKNLTKKLHFYPVQ